MNSFKYFENRECRYYPCHDMPGDKGVNCLFCYCPLFHLNDCPGEYHYIEKNGRIRKSCVDCSYIHDEDNYREILKLLRDSTDSAT
ncbi:MAG: metal-binding protein [Lachnospiraceae bacterium]|nr:metal-binding protein [Lachnospiraceae bacterium]